jgi:predicted RNA-binding Zn-ribbon protein involved in translation (DUF1610 family)
MPTVSCPSCATRQSVDASATSYTCTSCGKSWDFVVCSSCGSRYHAKPGATGWTCPNCGTVNPAAAPVPAAAMAVSGDDLDAVPPENLAGPQQPFGTPEPGSAFPMPQADRPGGFPRWGFAVIAVVVVAIVGVFLLTRGGDDAPGDTPAPNADEAIATMCTDVQQGTQLLRDDALGRAQDTLTQDAAAIKRAGDTATAKQVKVLIARIEDLRTAFQEQAPTDEATAAMAEAVSALPC